MELDGKVALVTGAGSGIGRATANRLAQEGARVAVLSDTEWQIREAATEIAAVGGKAIPIVADVASAEQMKAAVDETLHAFGRLDILFANAGINGVWAPIDELQPHEFDRTIAVNLRGTYLAIHYAVPHLKRAGRGAILITSSINGTRTFTSAGATAYSCTKAAQVAMAQMLALELAPHSIRVNVICPGQIVTEIMENTVKRNTEAAGFAAEYPDGTIPLSRRPGTAEEVADLALFLVSERSRHITGTPVWIDGGQSLLL